MSTPGPDTEMNILGHFTYLSHEYATGLRDLLTMMDDDRLDFPGPLVEQFRATAASLTALADQCVNEAIRREFNDDPT